MVKVLSFKGDKKPKKRKRTYADEDEQDEPISKQMVLAGVGEPEEDDNWVSAEALTDITGPVMLVLPTEPVTCLAADAMGKVYASTVENVVEGSSQSAEPHLTSQVWIATRVVGSEGDFTLKGNQGRYLGCDKYGICSATREAISPEETFRISTVAEGPAAFDFKTGHSFYISVDDAKSPPEIRGDAEDIGDATHVRIRMQARFKPKHKVEKAEKIRAKISRKELEEEVGRRLEDEEVKKLKRARKDGSYHEAMLDVKVKGKHDKFA